jgi:hypothetical protein
MSIFLPQGTVTHWKLTKRSTSELTVAKITFHTISIILLTIKISFDFKNVIKYGHFHQGGNQSRDQSHSSVGIPDTPSPPLSKRLTGE